MKPRKQSGIAPIVIVLIIIGILIITGWIWYWQTQKGQQVACTMEAKQCPDGSYVGRIAPDCEFAQCPEGEIEISDWQTYRNEKYGFEVKYPRNFRLVENENWGKSRRYLEDPVIHEVALIQDIYTFRAQIPVISLEVAKTDKTIDQLLDYLKEAINKLSKLQVEDPQSPFYGWPPPEIKSIETITIEGLKTTKVVLYMGPGAPLSSLLQYYVMCPGHALIFSSNYDIQCGTNIEDCGATEKEILPKILPKILSTFEFLD